MIINELLKLSGEKNKLIAVDLSFEKMSKYLNGI
jgi:hypothetical protein